MTKNWNQIQADTKKEVEAIGFHYVADRPFSDIPGDWYLRIVTGWRKRQDGTTEHATWLYNASLGGLHEGHYMMNRHQAIQDFHERG